MKTETQIQRVELARLWGFDLTKDYFSLDWGEISRLENLRKICGYEGNNTLGRSRSRQFWYYLQNGHNKTNKH